MKIIRNERQKPADKLADAELHFSGEPLDGLKLIGFAIWRRRDGSRGFSVTFPARPFNVNGDKTNFALLRAIDETRSSVRFCTRCRRSCFDAIYSKNSATDSHER